MASSSSNIESDIQFFSFNNLHSGQYKNVPRNIGIWSTMEIREFKERPMKLDKFEYERNGSKSGKVIIFHHEEYEHFTDKRKGNKRDVNEIVDCLQRYGYNIEDEDIYEDKTKEEVEAILEAEAAKDFSDYNSLIVFYFTHGSTKEILLTKDSRFDKQTKRFENVITTRTVWQAFGNCKTLNTKPKIFVFQACKGELREHVKDDDKSDEEPVEPIEFIPEHYFSIEENLPADMLIVYSTIENKLSFRNPATGSWFIQELCKNILSYGRRDDIFSLLIRTTKCVCSNYYAELELEQENSDHKQNLILKQLPMFVSTLRRKFYLNTNKDRHSILQVLESNAEIKETLKNIEKKLDKLLDK